MIREKEPEPLPTPNETKLNPIAPRKAKIVCNFGLSECNRVNIDFTANTCTNNKICILFCYKIGIYPSKITINM